MPLASADLVRGVLPAPIWVRTVRIVTLNAGLVIKTIEHVGDDIATRCAERCCAQIGMKR